MPLNRKTAVERGVLDRPGSSLGAAAQHIGEIGDDNIVDEALARRRSPFIEKDIMELYRIQVERNARRRLG